MAFSGFKLPPLGTGPGGTVDADRLRAYLLALTEQIQRALLSIDEENMTDLYSARIRSLEETVAELREG